MILSPHPATLTCDAVLPVACSSETLAKLGDKGPPVAQCKRSVSVRLMLTVQGTWIPRPVEGWQLLRIPGTPHSLFGSRCPEHHAEVERPQAPSGLVGLR